MQDGRKANVQADRPTLSLAESQYTGQECLEVRERTHEIRHREAAIGLDRDRVVHRALYIDHSTRQADARGHVDQLTSMHRFLWIKQHIN